MTIYLIDVDLTQRARKGISVPKFSSYGIGIKSVLNGVTKTTKLYEGETEISSESEAFNGYTIFKMTAGEKGSKDYRISSNGIDINLNVVFDDSSITVKDGDSSTSIPEAITKNNLSVIGDGYIDGSTYTASTWIDGEMIFVQDEYDNCKWNYCIDGENINQVLYFYYNAPGEGTWQLKALGPGYVWSANGDITATSLELTGFMGSRSLTLGLPSVVPTKKKISVQSINDYAGSNSTDYVPAQIINGSKINLSYNVCFRPKMFYIKINDKLYINGREVTVEQITIGSQSGEAYVYNNTSSYLLTMIPLGPIADDPSMKEFDLVGYDLTNQQTFSIHCW